MNEITTEGFKKIKVSVGVIIIMIPLFIMGINYVKSIAENVETLVKHDIRITAMEQNYQSSRDILMELKFNLKKLMKSQGEEYIDLDKNNGN